MPSRYNTNFNRSSPPPPTSLPQGGLTPNVHESGESLVIHNESQQTQARVILEQVHNADSPRTTTVQANFTPQSLNYLEAWRNPWTNLQKGDAVTIMHGNTFIATGRVDITNKGTGCAAIDSKSNKFHSQVFNRVNRGATGGVTEMGNLYNGAHFSFENATNGKVEQRSLEANSQAEGEAPKNEPSLAPHQDTQGDLIGQNYTWNGSPNDT